MAHPSPHRILTLHCYDVDILKSYSQFADGETEVQKILLKALIVYLGTLTLKYRHPEETSNDNGVQRVFFKEKYVVAFC